MVRSTQLSASRQGNFLAEYRILDQQVDRAPVVHRHAIAQIERDLLEIAQIAGQPIRIVLLRGSREQGRFRLLVLFDQAERAREREHRFQRILVIVALAQNFVERQAQQPRGIVATLLVTSEPEQVLRHARRNPRSGMHQVGRADRAAQQRKARVDRTGGRHPGILGAAAALRRHEALIGAACDAREPAGHDHVSGRRANGEHAQADAARRDTVRTGCARAPAPATRARIPAQSRVPAGTSAMPQARQGPSHSGPRRTPDRICRPDRPT